MGRGRRETEPRKVGPQWLTKNVALCMGERIDSSPPARMDTEADIVVIGCGPGGSSVATFLARAGCPRRSGAQFHLAQGSQARRFVIREGGYTRESEFSL